MHGLTNYGNNHEHLLIHINYRNDHYKFPYNMCQSLDVIARTSDLESGTSYRYTSYLIRKSLLDIDFNY